MWLLIPPLRSVRAAESRLLIFTKVTAMRLPNRLPFSRAIAPCCLFVCVMSAVPVVHGADKPDGKAIYAARCAECHGADGGGVEKVYSKPLEGDLSVKELSKYIAETMPEEDPESCTGKDADAVAAYIYDAFYSPTAQVRNRPPTIEMSRLTVRQYRNSVADLVGQFGSPGKWDERRGLEAEYFKSRRRRRNERQIERIDATVDFDFGEGSADAEKIPPEEFSIQWRGSVRTTETGVYEFVFETHNAGQLWVNDEEKPLIDAKVRSGDQNEYRESIFLLGGRAYPLRLEFTKSKSEKTALVRLKWRPPHHTDEVIPARNLSPNRFPSVLVVETAFPPDDKSVGYERGISVSKAWDEATTYGAIEVADKVLKRIDRLANLPREREKHAEKLKQFCQTFAERAFRRPLTDEQKALYIERQFAEAGNERTAVKRVILLALKSPRFLFPGAATDKFDDYRFAEWLALSLWDSLPDGPLLEAAAKGELHTRKQLAAQAARMTDDFRTRAKVLEFFHQWLDYDRFNELDKSEELYPEFTPGLVSDLRTSLDLFVDDVVWSDTSDYRRLLLADEVYLNARLAKYYGVEFSGKSGFEKVAFEPEHRAGLLSHPYLMSGLAYGDASSPIHRGVFLSRSLLGRFLKPPPVAIAPVAVDLHPDLTTRQRVELQTAATTCKACHGMINGLGFSLENFDAVGRYRDEERGRPIDAEGEYINRNGDDVRFRGARKLAAFLAASPEAHAAFTEQLFQYLIKQPIQAFGPETLPRLRGSFEKDGYNIRHLVARIAVESGLAAKDVQSKKANERK